MANKWIAHIKKTMKAMKSKGSYVKGKGLKQVIAEAKKTWKKHGGGEESSSDEDAPVAADVPVMAGRRRGRGKTQRRRKH
jgi:hypothetical protein